MQPIIELQNVSFGKGKNLVVDNISLTINAGDYVGLIGPNGGGKTTVLKIILGLLPPTNGIVRLFNSEKRQAKLQQKIGYVPQNVVGENRHFPASVYEVVRSGLVAKKGFFNSFTNDDEKLLAEAFELTNTAHLRNRLIAHLSGGERQRVFIARALISKPEILILDEPTTGIDAPSQDAFYALLENLNKNQNLTILLVSHDIDIITTQINRVFCINRNLVFHGSPQDFVKENQIEKLYGNKIKLISHNHPHN